MRLATPLALTFLVSAASLASAHAATLRVPQQYPTIGAAVAAARSGDTVQVTALPNGQTYNEAVLITTPHLTLQGVRNPIIDGTNPVNPYSPTPNGVEIEANYVTVNGFTVQNFATGAFPPVSGINVGISTFGFPPTNSSFNHIQISGNIVQKDSFGISISGQNGTALLSGYQVLNNLVTQNAQAGVVILANGVTVSGNHFTQNALDGLDITGDGLQVSSNELGNNGFLGLTIQTSDYNPAVHNPQSPNPPASVVSLNSIHDNQNVGISTQGTSTITGNLIANNVGYGISGFNADYSVMSYNAISGTSASFVGPGVGLSVDGNNSGDLSVIGNLISGNGVVVPGSGVDGSGGDGIYVGNIGGSLFAGNIVTNNPGIGIHVSDLEYQDSLSNGTPDVANTITQNYGHGNAIFDAQDDLAAIDGSPAGSVPNIWKNNSFGTTNPPNLSH